MNNIENMNPGPSVKDEAWKKIQKVTEAKFGLMDLEEKRKNNIDDYRKVESNLGSLGVDRQSETAKDILDPFLEEMAQISKEMGEIKENNGFKEDRVKTLEQRLERLQYIDNENRNNFFATEPGKEYEPLLDQYSKRLAEQSDFNSRNRIGIDVIQADMKVLEDQLELLEKTTEGSIYASRRDKIDTLKGKVDSYLQSVKSADRDESEIREISRNSKAA
jgi:DNA repair ATPase RecN